MIIQSKKIYRYYNSNGLSTNVNANSSGLNYENPGQSTFPGSKKITNNLVFTQGFN